MNLLAMNLLVEPCLALFLGNASETMHYQRLGVYLLVQMITITGSSFYLVVN